MRVVDEGDGRILAQLVKAAAVLDGAPRQGLREFELQATAARKVSAANDRLGAGCGTPCS